MLERSQLSDKSAIRVAYIPATAADAADGRDAQERTGSVNLWNGRRCSATHLPPLHILKRQSLEQEISYLDPNVSVGERPARSETFEFR